MTDVTEFGLSGKAFHVVGLLTKLFLHVRKPVFSMLIRDGREKQQGVFPELNGSRKRGLLAEGGLVSRQPRG